MGCKKMCLSVALLPFLMICEHVRAQCTQPSFESKNVILSGSYLSTQSFPNGSTVTFECVIGHKPVNSRASKSVTCQGTQWTNLELDCTRKSCGSPKEFSNGKYEVESGILFGDKITAVCDKGYILDGQMKDRLCRDGGWDGRDPVCQVVKCEAPPTIENGQLEAEPSDSYDYSMGVSYRCNKGFSLIGKPELHCSEDGTFKPEPPKCLDVCPKPEIPHAIRIGGKSPPYELGNFIEYKCEDGYKLKGEDYIRCSEKGWSPELPQCIVVKCEAPPTIENGQLEAEPSDSYDYSMGVSYRCNKGFSLIGKPELHCSEDGTFKPEPPKCLDVCPKPEIPHAIRIGGKSPPYELGNFIMYKCEDGYKLKGEDYIRCSEKGWSPELPQCIATSISRPTTTTATIVTSDSTPKTDGSSNEEEDQNKGGGGTGITVAVAVAVAVGVLLLVILIGGIVYYKLIRHS